MIQYVRPGCRGFSFLQRWSRRLRAGDDVAALRQVVHHPVECDFRTEQRPEYLQERRHENVQGQQYLGVRRVLVMTNDPRSLFSLRAHTGSLRDICCVLEDLFGHYRRLFQSEGRFCAVIEFIEFDTRKSCADLIDLQEATILGAVEWRDVFHASVICGLLQRMWEVTRGFKDLLQRPQGPANGVTVGCRRDVEDRNDKAEDCRHEREEAAVEENCDVPVDVPTPPGEEARHERHQTRNRQDRALQRQSQGAQEEGQHAEAKVHQGQAAHRRRRVATF